MDTLKLYGFIALLVLLMGGVALFAHHERAVEDTKLALVKAAADKRQADADALHVQQLAKVQDDANTQIQALAVQLATAIAAPVPSPVVVRLCPHPAPTSAPPVPARSAASPLPGGDGTGGSPAGVQGHSEEGADIGTDVEFILNRVSAKLQYLQGYVKACQDSGNCAR